jgi:amino acid adenylation domain-containing protein
VIGAGIGGGAERDWVHWRSALADLPAVDLTGQPVAPGRAAGPRRHVTLTESTVEQLRKVGVSLEASLLAAVGLLVRRTCGAGDVAVALPVAVAGSRNVTLARLTVDGDPSVLDVASAAAERLDLALAHTALPYPELVRRLDPRRTDSRLCPVSIAFETLLTSGQDGPPMPVEPAPAVQLALTCTADGRLAASAPGLAAEAVDALLDDLCRLIDGIAVALAEDPQRPIGLLLAALPARHRPVPPDPAAVHRAVPGFVRFPAAPADLATRFAGVAAQRPQHPALDGGDGPVDYATLAARAGGIAEALRRAGGTPGDPVGLVLHHGTSTVAAILGTLAAGRCYVPLDPAYPTERLAHMAAHAGVTAVLTTADLAPVAAALSGAPVIDVATVPPAAYRVEPGVDPDAPAYLLYTSGSTGLPKGVAQSHRNVVHGIANHINHLRITPDDRISVLTSFSFDMAVTDLFSAVLSGATAVMVDVRRQGLAHLARALNEQAVTVYHSTPTVYRYLLDAFDAGVGAPLSRLRVVILGGEQMHRADVLRGRRHTRDDCVFVNGYGATEASFAVQWHLPSSERPDREVLPIGHPLPGYRIALTDGSGLPTTLAGEIVIESPHVALGYWRDPAQTAARFGVAADGTRTYRTGDLGRWLPDGRLLYVGRNDRQVKVRGYRVELDEVEARLAALPGVARAVALARADPTGTAEIVAYAQARADAHVDGPALRDRLAALVPDYLVPRTVVMLDVLPLTPTGKVDVAALPAPPPPVAEPPRDAVEALVAEVWCAALRLDAVGRGTNFFEAGGHSLLLDVVRERLTARTGRELTLLELYARPTVAGQAALLRDHRTEPTDANADVGLGAVRERVARRRAMRVSHGAGR